MPGFILVRLTQRVQDLPPTCRVALLPYTMQQTGRLPRVPMLDA
jgi:hypothetical protein